MAAKRPLHSTSYRGRKIVGHGRAATLRGAMLSATKRLITKRLSRVEILDRDERELMSIFWEWSASEMSIIQAFTPRGERLLKRERGRRVV